MHSFIRSASSIILSRGRRWQTHPSSISPSPTLPFPSPFRSSTNPQTQPATQTHHAPEHQRKPRCSFHTPGPQPGPVSPPSSDDSRPGARARRRRRRRRHEDGGGGGGGGGAPVAAAVRAGRAAARDPPVAARAGGGGAGAAAAGHGGGGGVHDAGGVHGAHALRLRHLHARLLPHALGRRPRLRLPLRRIPHQPLRDRQGHPLLARLLLSQGRLHMAYISQASIHVDVKSEQRCTEEAHEFGQQYFPSWATFTM